MTPKILLVPAVWLPVCIRLCLQLWVFLPFGAPEPSVLAGGIESPGFDCPQLYVNIDLTICTHLLSRQKIVRHTLFSIDCASIVHLNIPPVLHVIGSLSQLPYLTSFLIDCLD